MNQHNPIRYFAWLMSVLVAMAAGLLPAYSQLRPAVKQPQLRQLLQQQISSPAPQGQHPARPHFHQVGEGPCRVNMPHADAATGSATFEDWIDRQVAERLSRPERKRTSEVVYTLPVVFHIVHFGTAPGVDYNLPASQIESQLERLNQAFRLQGFYKDKAPASFADVTADLRVEFKMALVDPDGQPMSEPGVHRFDITTSGLPYETNEPFSSEDVDWYIKPATVWDPYQYLNIWVVPMSNGLLGFAQFPIASGKEGLDFPSDLLNLTDGVAIHPVSFGVRGTEGDIDLLPGFGAGGVLVHEVGHWLGLRHIWGDGDCSVDDFVEDTPPQDGPSQFDCQTDVLSCDGVRKLMPQNFMDYSNDEECMSIFTKGQSERAMAVLENSPRRKELLTSPALDPAFTAVGLMISEIGVNGAASFVEITNAHPTESYTTTGLELTWYANGDTTQGTNIALTANVTLAPGESFVVANQAISGHDGKADQIAANFGANGNDPIVLFDTKSKRIADQYGEYANGTGAYWEYASKLAVRKPTVTVGNYGRFNQNRFGEWTLSDYNSANATPQTHTLTPPQFDLSVTTIARPIPEVPAVFCSNEVLSPYVVVRNNGAGTITSFSIRFIYGMEGDEPDTTTFEIPEEAEISLDPGEIIELDFEELGEFIEFGNVEEGMLLFRAEALAPNGQADEVPTNDGLQIRLNVASAGRQLIVSGKMGSRVDDIGLVAVLYDASRSLDEALDGLITGDFLGVYAVGGSAPNEEFITSLCLPEGCYNVLIIGTGLEDYTLLDDSGNILAANGFIGDVQGGLDIAYHGFCLPAFAKDAAISNVQGGTLDGLYCGDMIAPDIELINVGYTAIESVRVEYGYQNTFALNATFEFDSPLMPGTRRWVTLPASDITPGSYTFVSKVTTINGSAPDRATNGFQIGAGEFEAEDGSGIGLSFSGFQEAAFGYIIRTEAGDTIFESGELSEIVGYQACLPEGCYSLEILPRAAEEYIWLEYTLIDQKGNLLLQGIYEGEGTGKIPFCIPVTTVADIVKESPIHQILWEAIQKTGVEFALRAEAPLSLFAPTDAAFETLFTQLGIDGLDDVATNDLLNILSLHALGTFVPKDTLVEGRQFISFHGAPLNVSLTGNDIFVNEGKLLTNEIEAINGSVYAMDRVLLPNTLWEKITSDTAFALLEEALLYTGLDEALRETRIGGLTVFAPNNAALENVLGGTAISNIPEEEVERILLYHVVPELLDANQLTAGSQAQTLHGGFLSFGETNDTITVNGYPLARLDIVADNGVMHEITAVLQPNTVADYLATSSDLNIFSDALLQSGQNEILRSTNPVTVFAPDNAAMVDFLDQSAYFNVVFIPQYVLEELLAFHIVNSSLDSASILQGQTETTFHGASLNFDQGPVAIDPTFSQTKAKLLEADILLDNGYVHRIDQVLYPNTQYDLTWQSFELNLTNALIRRAGLKSLLKSDPGSGFTFFAPNITAFANADIFDEDDINALTPQAAESLVRQHVVEGSFASAALTNGQQLTTLAGTKLTVTIDNGKVLINGVEVVTSDQTASNGVMHILGDILKAPTTLTDADRPTNLTAVAITANSISLQWQDNSNKETAFGVFRRVGNGSWDLVADLMFNITTYLDTQLSPETAYQYRVGATDNKIDYFFSDPDTFTTQALAPTGATNLTATALSPSEIRLNWVDGQGETGYRVERSLANNGPFNPVTQLGANANTYTVTNLAENTIFFFRVIGFNASGDGPASNVASDTTLITLPNAPQGLTASALSSTQIKLDWTDNTDETGYRLEQATAANGPFTQIATPSANTITFTVGSLQPSTQYFFRLFATNAGGSSQPSTVVNATTLIAPPATPTNVTATAVSATEIRINWADVATETGYKVQIANAVGGPFTDRTIPAANATSSNITGLADNTAYFFRVIASNAGGESAPSAVVTASTPPLALDDALANALLLYPNPAGHTLTVELQNAPSFGRQIAIAVYSLTGQKLLEQPAKLATETATFTLSTSQLPDGLYLVEIRADDRIAHKKVTIRR